MNQYLGTPIIPTQIVTKISYSRLADANEKDIFETMSDVKDYPKILPDNFRSVKILNHTKTTIYAEEEIFERGISTKLIVRYIIHPYENQSLQVITGDAQNTTIIENFKANGSSTIITTHVEMHLKGLLVPFGLLPQDNLEHAVNTVIDSFVIYTKDHKAG